MTKDEYKEKVKLANHLTTIGTIKDITWSMSRFGKLTPVAEIDPVYINNVKISKVTLNNLRNLKNLHLNIGDKVKLIRSGEVIPKIIEVVERVNKDNAEAYDNYPAHCPYCDTILQPTDTDLYCVNKECPEQLILRFDHFVSDKAMNIPHFNKTMIRYLVNQGLIPSLSSLYSFDFIENYLGPGSSKSRNEKIMMELERSKSLPLRNFIYSLSIPGVTLKVAEVLEKELGKDWYEVEDFNLCRSLIGKKSTLEFLRFLFKNKDEIKYLMESSNFKIEK